MYKEKSYWLGWVICGIAALFYCYEYLLRASPEAMDQDLMAAYHLTASGYGSLVAFYYHLYTPMQLFVGVLMDRYLPRALLFISCLCCAIGAFLFGATSHVWVAIIGRALIGFGSAFAFVGVLKLATLWLPQRYFAFVSGCTTALGMLGAVLANSLLERLVTTVGWRQALNISSFFGVLLTILIFCVVRNGRNEVQESAEEQLHFAPLLQGLWVLMRSRQMWMTGAVGCVMYLSASTFAELWSVPYLRDVCGFVGHSANDVNTLVFFGWATGAATAGLYSDYLRSRKLPLMIGAGCVALLMLVLFYTPGLSHATIKSCLFCIGLFSGSQVLVFAIACESSPKALSGTAIALTNMLVMIGGNVLQPLVGVLLDWHWQGVLQAGHRIYSAEDYHSALVLLPILYCFVFLFSAFMKETHYNHRSR